MMHLNTRSKHVKKKENYQIIRVPTKHTVCFGVKKYFREGCKVKSV